MQCDELAIIALDPSHRLGKREAQTFDELKHRKVDVRIEPQYPGLTALHDRIAARPNIAAYRRSSRHMAFNDRGIFRHYPELDAPQE